MDPHTNIKRQLELAREQVAAADAIDREEDVQVTVSDESLALAELVIALDEWRKGGGFDPYQHKKSAGDYEVVWRMNIDADSPQEAAEEALRIHRDPESIAVVFEVDGETIDLLEDED